MIAKYILGDPNADAWAAGCALSSDFIKARPEVAKRFAEAWAKAVDYIKTEPAAARKYLAKNTMTPDDLVDVVPMLGYAMTKDSAQAAGVPAALRRLRHRHRRRAREGRREKVHQGF